MDFLFTVGAFLLALGVLIVFHELGHYWVARWAGVKVLRFSVGFGKILWSRRFGRDQTEWAVAAFPLGGYVKMLDEREGEVSPQELPRAFNRQLVGKRFAIVAAGPIANLLLAIILYWALYMHGVMGVRPIIGEIPVTSAAAKSGFARGDVITSVNGESVQTWQDVRWEMLDSVVDAKSVDLGTANGVIRTLPVAGLTPEDLEGDFLHKLGLTYFEPDVAAVIGRVMAGGPAQAAGLVAGDRIVSANGKPVTQWREVVALVRANPGRTLAFTVERQGQTRSLKLVPATVRENGTHVGRAQAAPQTDPMLEQRMFIELRYPAGAALKKAVVKTWDTSIFSLKMLGKMLTGDVSWKNLSGPLTIADYAGQTANLGLVPYLTFLALISISLGVLNLLPIPVLDGGHLMYYMAEIIRGRPVSERALQIGQQVGFALLLTLMIFALFNDITRLMPGI